MNRKLKALGLALVAVFAMSALSAASASAVEFHSSVAHTELRGEQHAGEDTFTVNAGTVRCSHATYTGTETSATATTQSVTPAYTGCKAFGFVNTTIDTNGCSYRFDSNGNNVDIICPGNPITVTAFNCWVTVGSQENLGTVTYTNVAGQTTKNEKEEVIGVHEDDVTVDVNITGIKYTQHSKSFPGCTNGTFTNGTYTGSATVRGFNTAGEQVDIWVA
ncbi:MAG TPA: hypothetical protein VF255_02920 [Solirubrobacterales bacterium]